MIPIANPIASNQQVEIINKILKSSDLLISGVKACTKEIKNETKGIVILTGDTSPMDLITHIPALCEEKGIKYIFVKKKEDLVKPSTAIFIKKSDGVELYDTLK